MEWISVKDRFPEINEKSQSSVDVLISCSDGILVARVIFYKAMGYKKEDTYYWSEQSTGCGCCAASIEPTHWMPLPEPPKESDAISS